MLAFSDNAEFIETHNKEAAEGKHTFILEVNKYADWTQEELKQRNNLKVKSQKVESIWWWNRKTEADPDRPASIDWRDYVGYVNQSWFYHL